jgi:hypothetical protein
LESGDAFYQEAGRLFRLRNSRCLPHANNLAARIDEVASLLATVDALCVRYLSTDLLAVQLRDEISELGAVLNFYRNTNADFYGDILQLSQPALNAPESCLLQLKGLETQLSDELNPGGTQKVMRRLGLRSLKWPFTGAEVDGIATSLAEQRHKFCGALSLQMYVRSHC